MSGNVCAKFAFVQLVFCKSGNWENCLSGLFEASFLCTINICKMRKKHCCLVEECWSRCARVCVCALMGNCRGDQPPSCAFLQFLLQTSGFLQQLFIQCISGLFEVCNIMHLEILGCFTESIDDEGLSERKWQGHIFYWIFCIDHFVRSILCILYFVFCIE